MRILTTQSSKPTTSPRVKNGRLGSKNRERPFPSHAESFPALLIITKTKSRPRRRKKKGSTEPDLLLYCSISFLLPPPAICGGEVVRLEVPAKEIVFPSCYPRQRCVRGSLDLRAVEVDRGVL